MVLVISDQTKNKEVRILSSRVAILKLPSHVKYVEKNGPRCNKLAVVNENIGGQL